MEDKALSELSENYPGSCRIGKGNASFLVVNIHLQKNASAIALTPNLVVNYT
jgi:hypothetical protein